MENVAPMESDMLHLKLHVKAFSRHFFRELVSRAKWGWMKGWRFSVLLKDTSKGHTVFAGDLSVSKRAASPTGRPAVKWLIIMQEREIQAPNSNDCTWEAPADRTGRDAQRALGSVHTTSEITEIYCVYTSFWGWDVIRGSGHWKCQMDIEILTSAGVWLRLWLD